MSAKAKRQTERADALNLIRRWVSEGSTIFYVTRSVSRSGMSRRVDYYVFVPLNGEPANRQLDKIYLSGYMARALGLPWSDDGIRTYSADDPVYHLSYALFGHQNGMKLRAERI